MWNPKQCQYLSHAVPENVVELEPTKEPPVKDSSFWQGLIRSADRFHPGTVSLSVSQPEFLKPCTQKVWFGMIMMPGYCSILQPSVGSFVNAWKGSPRNIHVWCAKDNRTRSLIMSVTEFILIITQAVSKHSLWHYLSLGYNTACTLKTKNQKRLMHHVLYSSTSSRALHSSPGLAQGLIASTMLSSFSFGVGQHAVLEQTPWHDNWSLNVQTVWACLKALTILTISQYWRQHHCIRDIIWFRQSLLAGHAKVVESILSWRWNYAGDGVLGNHL